MFCKHRSTDHVDNYYQLKAKRPKGNDDTTDQKQSAFYAADLTQESISNAMRVFRCFTYALA